MATRILIIEDHTLAEGEVRKRLLEMGYEALRGASNSQLPAQIRKQRPEIVMMGVKQANESQPVSRKEISPDSRLSERIFQEFQIPIVYLIQESDLPILQGANLPGAYGYLRLPLLDIEVRNCIEMALFRVSAERKQDEKQGAASSNSRPRTDGMKNEEALYQTLASNFPNGTVLLLDRNLQFVLAGGRGLAQLGLNGKDFIGKSLYDVFEGIPGAREAEKLYERALEGHEEDSELEIGGFQRWVHALPIKENGEITGVLGMSQDITGLKRAQQALRESEERLRFVTDNARVGLVMLNAERRYTFANVVYTQILGLPSPHIVGQRICDVLPDLYESQIRPRLDRAFAGERVSYELYRPGGEEDRYFMVKYEPTCPDGKSPLVVVVITDITERKRAENELRESEARFRSMADTSPVFIWVTAVDASCTYLNKSWLEFTGRPLEAQLGDGWLESVHPDDLEATHSHFCRSCEARTPFEMEYRLRRYDGIYRWILVRGVPRFSVDGLYLGYIGTCVDIDDVRRANAELFQSQERLAGVVDSAMDAIITIDESRRILLFNPAATKMFGYESADVLGQPLEILMPERFRATHPTHIMAFGQNGATNRRMGALGTVSGVRANGEEFPIEASISQIQLDSQRLFTVILRDVTERRQTELALLESEERFRQMAESSSEVFWMIDPVTWKTLYVSPAYERIWGRSREEFCQNFGIFEASLHPDDRAQIVEVLRTQATAGPFEREYRILRPDGEMRWVWHRSVPIRNHEGQIYRVVGTVQDITERRHAQDALQRAHAEAEKLVAKRTAELAKSNDALVDEAKERQIAMGALREAIGQLESARDETERANTELRANELRLLQGNRTFTELTKIPVTSADDLARAIGDIVQAGSEIIEVERCSVWLYNDDQSAIHCFDLYERTQKRHSHGLELRVHDFPHYFAALQSREAIVANNAHTHGATREFSASYLKPLNITSMLDVPIVFNGQMVGVLCCEHIGDARQWKVEDLTFARSLAGICSLAIESLERARAEAALRQAKDEAEHARQEAESANYAKSEFLSRMSHELRTPLNSILGFGQLLKRTPLDAKQNERLDLILNAGRHLLELINEVLDIARVESGRLHFSIEPVRIAEVVGESLALMQPLAERQNIRIQNETENGEQFALADRQRLKQVLLNLLSNAVKYNYTGGSIGIRCATTDAGKLQVSISNTGHGISSEYISRLFTPFERLGQEASQIEGTGLGLALSKRLVEAMNGTIQVESTPDAQTTFHVVIPVGSNPQEAILGENYSRHTPGTLKSDARVLYIEDNLANLKLIEGIFTDIMPLRLIPAMQGRLGLELACEHVPDLILLDLHLPDLDGSEVLRRLKDNEATRDIPVVILSADATQGQIERLLTQGATRYLTKPLDVEQFLKVMDELLNL